LSANLQYFFQIYKIKCAIIYLCDVQISVDSLAELEFPELLKHIVPFAFSPKIAKKIENILPLPFENAENSLKKVAEYLKSFENLNAIPFNEYDDIEEELKVLHIENYRLDSSSFMRIKNISIMVGKLVIFFKKFNAYYPINSAESKNIKLTREIIEKINKVFNRYGEIKSDASEYLTTIRKEIQNARKAIDENFNQALSHCSMHDFLDDIRETIIDNQRVLAVKSGFKKRIRGRVLGISKTGAVSYIQPESIVKHQFILRENLDEEKKEIDRILRILTSEIAIFKSLLKIYQEYIFDIDLVQAKARFAHKIGAILPNLNNEKKVKLIDAFHPLLWLKNKNDDKQTYPQSIEFSTKNRIICISGPNAGGKSISLKTIGLLQLMLQSGILIPVHSSSDICFFDKILTDIGDNQSIENHLSTYSSRLKRMAKIINEADENTLLLIDEFGTGSDPQLGGALAESFLEFFYNKGSFAIITTHYTNIKIVVDKLANATNAAMLFDEKSLKPLYKLEIGQAGSSFTFEVAEKNKIPRFIIKNAKKKVEHDIVNLDKTIVKLQQEKFEVEKLKYDLSNKKDSVQEKRENIKKLNDQLEQKLFNFQKLYEQENKRIQFGYKVESFISDYTNGKPRKEIVQNFIKILEQEKHKNKETDKSETEKLKIVKKKLAEQLKKEIVKEKIALTHEKLEQEQKQERSLWLKIGQKVRISGNTSVGTIEKIHKNKVVINYGIFKTTINPDELERA